MRFKEIGLNKNIQKAIEDLNFKILTPIQQEAIPYLLENKTDLIALAQTGTGKTAAFVLPILERLIKKSKKNSPKSFPFLILVPTRELAMQIIDKIRAYGKIIRPKAVLIVGGAKPGPQIKSLKDGSFSQD